MHLRVVYTHAFTVCMSIWHMLKLELKYPQSGVLLTSSLVLPSSTPKGG